MDTDTEPDPIPTAGHQGAHGGDHGGMAHGGGSERGTQIRGSNHVRDTPGMAITDLARGIAHHDGELRQTTRMDRDRPCLSDDEGVPGEGVHHRREHRQDKIHVAGARGTHNATP